MSNNKTIEMVKKIIIVILMLMSIASLAMAVRKGISGGIDFQWDSAKLLARRIDPYEASLNEASPYHISEYGVVEANQFPSLLWLLFPYTLFDGKTAKIAWIISNFIFLTGIVVLLNAFLENKISKTDRWLVNSILLSCGCVRSQIHLGQHSLYAFFFFLLALWMSKKNKKIVSGLLLSISYFKYSITAPLALYFLYKKKYKELVVSFVPHIVLTLFSSWWLSINPIEIMLLPVKQATGLSTSGFADIGSILKSFGYHGSVMIFTVVIFIGLIIWVSFVKNKITDYGMLCILALWSLVFMYHRRYDYFVLILPFASIFMENTRKSKCWNICVCVLTIGVLTMGNFMDLESSVGKTVNSIMTSYIPYTSLCNVFNAILIALLYLVLFMSHRVFLENKRSIKKENEGEI